MNRISRIVAGSCTLVLAAVASPALAQYANQFTPAKVTKQGPPSHNIAGTGSVEVKVQVNADGSHKVIQVLNSTNPADNAAAMDIAQSSTYSPAHKGSTPVPSFYTFHLRFNGKAVVQSEEEQAISGQSGGADTNAIDALVRSGKYKDAIAKANAALLSSPGNPAVLQLLGVAQYYDNDFVDAATTFSRVDDIKKPFQPIAAQAFATGAVRVSQSNPTQSLDFAHKAVALAPDPTERFALGVAQLANKQYADAVTTLKGVHDQVSGGDPKAKLNIDQELLQAYLDTNDQAGANAIAAEMKTLDPSGTAPAKAVAQHYLQAGSDAMQANDYASALKDFDQAASAGSAADAVTANTFAAFAVMKMDKPDYVKAKDYATKAVAGAPQDAQANYALGIAYAGIYNSSHKADDKTQALTYLKKSDDLAKAAGNEGLALQIENQIKNIPQ
ncbi:MAG TPA: tetratricopeptide repeat protein [Candidatus Acidoferrum sp.]|jgi:tetratricopeptide (TPR) repeat protein|nr:tetratricopeptide repeat protein [Candidatus Acidoferrum sp.]